MMDQYQQFAVTLARDAGAVMRKNFSLGMTKDWKDDDSPITVTDRAINQMVLDEIGRAWPEHAIIAEEGSMMKESEYVWVCDPIDGTVPFSHGYPTFGFSLALTKNGESILGVVYDPMSDRLVTAQKGGGTFLNGNPIRVSSARALSKTSFINLDGDNTLQAIRVPFIQNGCYVSTFYSCVYASMLVAAGEFVAEIYDYKNPWDAAAVKIIVEEAGGRVTDLFGGEQRYDQTIGGFVATNGLLHDEFLSIIRRAREGVKKTNH